VIQRDYSRDPALLERVMRLLGIVFPFVPDEVDAARRIGLAWDEVSIPFVVTDGSDGPVIAHVGVLELPLVLEGVSVVAAGLHAVATHPHHRRQGHYRRIMESVIPYVSGRYELALLTTDRPAIYEPFGFRDVGEHRFVGPAPPVGARGAGRRLDYDDPADVARLDGDDRSCAMGRLACEGAPFTWPKPYRC
jgi:predicted N-acetyltransferase YhbS